MSGKRKLGRATSHRIAMLRALVTFLFENGKIETTVTRAKEVRSLAEKMITTAKVNDLHNKRMIMAFITKKEVGIAAGRHKAVTDFLHGDGFHDGLTESGR